MTIIYLETNSILAIAKGRNQELEDFIYGIGEGIKLIIPSICLMEALVAIESDEKASRNLIQTLEISINEAKRNKGLNQSQSFANYLELSLIDFNKVLQNFQERFLNFLDYFNEHGELIEPNISLLKTTFNQPLIKGRNQKRDDFILQVILAHAQNNLNLKKAFFSENTKEFYHNNIQNILATFNITYFSKVSNLKSWLNQNYSTVDN